MIQVATGGNRGSGETVSTGHVF